VAGIKVQILTTAGSVENLGWLRRARSQGGADIAFVQGGLATPSGESDLTALASLFVEPLWVFYRGTVHLKRFSALAGKRIAVGQEGSGTRSLALRLLTDSGITPETATLLPLGGGTALGSLRAGTADAALVVAALEAPLISAFTGAAEVRLMTMDRVDAYTRIYPFLVKLTLPEGLLDLRFNRPPADVTMLATTANLVARSDLHPAFVALLLQAATAIHGPGTRVSKQGEFPTIRYVDFPLSREARRYFEYGAPLLQRYLPFWAAVWIDRLKVMLLPLVTLFIPLVRIMPPVYRWRIRRRIFRCYRMLQRIESCGMFAATEAEHSRCLDELAQLEQRILRIQVPLSFDAELYQLRLHLHFIHGRLLAVKPTARADARDA
jgi:hypothetical protein